jgi:hypothetical protein
LFCTLLVVSTLVGAHMSILEALESVIALNNYDFDRTVAGHHY